MATHHGTHSDLHHEQGALPGEHFGRAKNPVIKVVDLAWLEFEKPDLGAWLSKGHCVAALVRPDYTVLQAGRDLTAVAGTTPRFSAV